MKVAGSIASKANASAQKYYVLLLLTDGIIEDMEDTIREIIKCSGLPLSIIIVGVGSADFSAMSALDSDDKLLSIGGSKALRDIVQFVGMCFLFIRIFYRLRI